MASIFTSTGTCSSWAATFVAPWWTLPGAKGTRFKCVTGCICLTEMAALTLFSLLQVMDKPAHNRGLLVLLTRPTLQEVTHLICMKLLHLPLNYLCNDTCCQTTQICAKGNKERKKQLIFSNTISIFTYFLKLIFRVLILYFNISYL